MSYMFTWYLYLHVYAAGTLENVGDELLLSREFVRKCRETYSVPIKAPETTCQKFPIKHINILDPLKDSNNLGRSVSKGIWLLLLADLVLDQYLQSKEVFAECHS